MYKKIFQIFAVIIFFSLFSYFYGSEYWNFQDAIKQEKNLYTTTQESIQGFSLSDIYELGDEVELHATPDLTLLDDIIDQIDGAQEKIYVEVYIFTEKGMRDALLRAYERGVDVKILLENNPYQAPYLNDAHYTAFQNAGIDVSWSDPLNYALNHSKLLIIDDISYISTGNFSYSLFKYNRDILIKIRNKSFNEKLISLFLSDFEGRKGGIYDENLVLSPEYSRSKIEYLIQSAQENMKVYFPYLADDGLEKLFIEKAQQGINIELIVDKDFYEESSNVVKRLSDEGIIIHPMKKIKLHAKSILVDNTYIYIGSINFSRYSLDENREMGLILKDEKIILNFTDLFYQDF